MVKSKNIWKPVEIDGNVFNSGIEGLIGIEECTDYDLDVIKQEKKKNKRKLVEITENEVQTKIKQKTQKKNVKEAPSKKSTKKLNDSKSHSTSSKLPKNEDILTPSKEGSTANYNNNAPEEKVEDNSNVESTEAWSNYGLPKNLVKALLELGFVQPTEIQALTLHASVLGRRDILGAAETGSGKTLAFGLPILTGIMKIKEKEHNLNKTEGTDCNSDDSDFEETEEDIEELNNSGIGCVRSINNVKLQNGSDKIKEQKPLYALILTPTRELAVQVKNHLIAVAKYTGINVAVVVGGMAAVKQERILSKGPEIVVATPGRLWELIQLGNSHLSQIDNIRFLAIDETDRMMERGHFQELHDILERVNLDETRKKLRQNFVFSATLTLVHDIPKHLKNKAKIRKSRKLHEMTPEQKVQKIADVLGITDPKVVDVTKGTGTSGTLTECRITCAIDEKDYYVYYFLQKHAGRTLIFCNSIGCVKRLTTLLGLLECNPLPLHASMQQRQRLKNLERFRDNPNGVLVATDVAARGLDIPGVEHVLHYQTPRTSESYVHRSGRTARAAQQGITVLLMEPTELPNYIKLCRTLGKEEDLPIFPVQDNFLNAVKLRVNLARELDKVQLHVKKTNSEVGWFQKAAEEMDIIIEDRGMKQELKEASQNKKVGEFKRKQLSSLLAKPIFPKGFSGKYALCSGDFDNLFMNSNQKEEKALDVMKSALEDYAKDKKKRIPLYKFSKNNTTKQNDNSVIKLNKFKNSRGKKNKFKKSK